MFYCMQSFNIMLHFLKFTTKLIDLLEIYHIHESLSFIF